MDDWLTSAIFLPIASPHYAAASSPRKDANVASNAVSALPIAASRASSTAYCLFADAPLLYNFRMSIYRTSRENHQRKCKIERRRLFVRALGLGEADFWGQHIYVKTGSKGSLLLIQSSFSSSKMFLKIYFVMLDHLLSFPFFSFDSLLLFFVFFLNGMRPHGESSLTVLWSSKKRKIVS